MTTLILSGPDPMPEEPIHFYLVRPFIFSYY